jgi:hypothetical protein
MSVALAPAEVRLLEVLAASTPGQRRNGVFALWLFVRACEGLLPPVPLSPRGQKSRVTGLARRLRSLALPSPLRRALAGGVRELAEATPHAAIIGLQQLVAPAREAVSTAAADAMAAAARAAREAVREARS